MVSVLVTSVVDRGFEPRSGQTKDYKIGIYTQYYPYQQKVYASKTLLQMVKSEIIMSLPRYLYFCQRTE
jgi:hypothetical protein